MSTVSPLWCINYSKRIYLSFPRICFKFLIKFAVELWTFASLKSAIPSPQKLDCHHLQEHNRQLKEVKFHLTFWKPVLIFLFLERKTGFWRETSFTSWQVNTIHTLIDIIKIKIFNSAKIYLWQMNSFDIFRLVLTFRESSIASQTRQSVPRFTSFSIKKKNEFHSFLHNR